MVSPSSLNPFFIRSVIQTKLFFDYATEKGS